MVQEHEPSSSLQPAGRAPGSLDAAPGGAAGTGDRFRIAALVPHACVECPGCTSELSIGRFQVCPFCDYLL